MSIRNSTETFKVMAGLAGAGGLAVAAALHGAWAAGTTWPADTSDDLADLVVGKRPMPGPLECAAVAAALGGASVATAGAALAGPGGGGLGGGGRRVAGAAAAALLARGVGGMIAGSLGLGSVTPRFRRWDRRLYSPLCLVLGSLIIVGRR